MNGQSTIPYSAVEERRRINKCIEHASSECERELYRNIRDMRIPYEKLDNRTAASLQIIKREKRRKELFLAIRAGGAAAGILLLLGIWLGRICKRRGMDESGTLS